MNPQYETVLSKFTSLRNRKDYLDEMLTDCRTKQDTAMQCYNDALKAREIIMRVAKETQQQLEMRITNIVSLALAAVFPDPYQFVLRFSERRNQTEADFFLVRDGEEIGLMDAAGGGVLDIVSFALRISILMMTNNRRIIILDEPFRHLSADLQAKASSMMKMLSDKLDVQFIMVSHEDGIIECADTTITIKNGRAV